MRWPWRRQGAIVPRRTVNFRRMELQTAKEILAEVFGARSGEVEEMIRRRLEESGPMENIWPEKREEGLWPATFCLGE